jgi:hypothetical protein
MAWTIIDSNNVLSFVIPAEHTGKNLKARVRVKNWVGWSDWVDSNIVVIQEATVPDLSIATQFIDPVIIGDSFSFALSAVGRTPYTWSLQQGVLPEGISLTGNILSGIHLGDLHIIQTFDTLQVLLVGDNTNIVFEAQGKEPHTWTLVGALPTGLAFNSTVPAITGSVVPF